MKNLKKNSKIKIQSSKIDSNFYIFFAAIHQSNSKKDSNQVQFIVISERLQRLQKKVISIQSILKSYDFREKPFKIV